MTHQAARLRPLDRAIAHHQAGRLAEAGAAYRRLLDNNPADADALHLLGLLACDQGAPDAALEWIDSAIRLVPNRAAYHNTRGRALALLDRGDQAELAYRLAWQLRPDLAEIANNLACLMQDRGEHEAAVQWFRRAHALAPHAAAIILNLAQALADCGAYAASLVQFEHALRLLPDSADAFYGMGRAHLLAGQPGRAEHRFAQALRVRPDHAGSHNNLGIALERQGRSQAAAQCFRDALRCDPNHADAHSNLGCLLLLDNLLGEARACQDRALSLAPLHGKALWARCMAELPVLYLTFSELAQQRERYRAALADLGRRAQMPAVRAVLGATAGSFQPFFLPYQGQCDRDLQAEYGALLTRLIDPDPAIVHAAAPAPGARVRLGIVTGFACEHTVWRLMVKGWLTHLNRERFCVALYHTGTAIDDETHAARLLADRFIDGPAGEIRAAILADRPHVLIYPEIGMDPVCARLAIERLAPLQCVAWGHPQTSGLPNIDVFLSAAAMEPPAAGLHYTERLVCLPGIGVHPMLQPGAAAAIGRAGFGLRADATVFWCGQSLYKYLPQHDQVFARIAQAVPDSQFVFIGFAKSAIATAQFRDRVARAFTLRGLDPARHCVILDPMDQAHFHASLRACDIVLDSIGWSGGKSSLDMLADARPIVTLEGGLMRARHTAAILRQLGVTETTADSIDRYVAIAIDLARAPQLAEYLGRRLAARLPDLLADLAPIRGLEAFVESALR